MIDPPTVQPSPKPTPGCDYCKAAKHALEAGNHVKAQAMKKIRELARENSKLTAERDAYRESLEAIMPMIEKTDEWNGQESMATKEYVQGLSDTLSEVYVFVDELLNKGTE